MIRLPALLCLFAASAMGGIADAAPNAAVKATPIPRDSVYQLPVRLTDQNARKFAWARRRGKVQLVSMFYTSCQYICPLIIDSGKAVERNLPPLARERLGILLISMDPKRDTPPTLMAVARARKLDLARWTLATPAADEVRAIAGMLGIRYRALDDGEFNHTSALVLLDADGRVLERTEQVGSVLDPEFLAAVDRAIAEPTRPR